MDCCWLVLRRLCVRRCPEGHVLRRRRVRRGSLLACLAAPLRQEVPRGACPEAQEGQAWLTADWSCGALASGGSPRGMS